MVEGFCFQRFRWPVRGSGCIINLCWGHSSKQIRFCLLLRARAPQINSTAICLPCTLFTFQFAASLLPASRVLPCLSLPYNCPQLEHYSSGTCFQRLRRGRLLLRVLYKLRYSCRFGGYTADSSSKQIGLCSLPPILQNSSPSSPSSYILLYLLQQFPQLGHCVQYVLVGIVIQH